MHVLTQTHLCIKIHFFIFEPYKTVYYVWYSRMYFIPLYFSKIFHVAGLANISSCESNTVSGVVAITDTVTVDICVPVSWNVWKEFLLGIC